MLALLKCAAEVSESLSQMTTARSRHHHQDDDDDGDGDDKMKSKSRESKAVVVVFEQLSAAVRSNGVGYLAGVTKLHELLSPHAELVKSYRNHHHHHNTTAAAAMNTSTLDYEGGASDTQNNNNNNGKQQQQQQQASEIASFTYSNEIVKVATSNMYAARVEKRLAVERREILKDMIRLEEEEELNEGVGGEEEGDFKSNKRKR